MNNVDAFKKRLPEYKRLRDMYSQKAVEMAEALRTGYTSRGTVTEADLVEVGRAYGYNQALVMILEALK